MLKSEWHKPKGVNPQQAHECFEPTIFQLGTLLCTISSICNSTAQHGQDL
jgi:hypothetical protein